MTDARWMARIRPNTGGYPILDRKMWYPVLSSDDLGSIVDLWGKQVFIFAHDAEFKLSDAVGTDLIGKPAVRRRAARRRRPEG